MLRANYASRSKRDDMTHAVHAASPQGEKRHRCRNRLDETDGAKGRAATKGGRAAGPRLRPINANLRPTSWAAGNRLTCHRSFKLPCSAAPGAIQNHRDLGPDCPSCRLQGTNPANFPQARFWITSEASCKPTSGPTNSRKPVGLRLGLRDTGNR